MEAEYGWREVAGSFIATYFDEFFAVLMVLICGAILFEVLGKRWEKRNEKDGEDNKMDE